MLPERVWVVWPGDDYPRAYLPASEVREHFRHPEQAGEYIRTDLHAAEVERLRKRCEVYRQHAVSATEHLAALGWVPFGTHSGDAASRLEFSADGPDGLPGWEREIPAPRATEGGNNG